MVDYAKLAELIGVEIGDTFVPKNLTKCCEYGKYRITLNGILYYRDNTWQRFEPRHSADHDFGDYLKVIGCLASGLGQIFICYNSELKDGDEYWSYAGNDWSITKYTWCGSMEDLARRNMCATFDKEYMALHNRPYIYKKITGKDWINS